jgi:hypothetical protein
LDLFGNQKVLENGSVSQSALAKDTRVLETAATARGSHVLTSPPETFVAPTLTWNSTRGGLDLRYIIQGGNLAEPANVTVSYANGPTSSHAIGGVLYVHHVPQGSAAGRYGPVHIPGTALTNDPAGTTHLVAATSPTRFHSLPDVRLTFGPDADRSALSTDLLDVIKDGLRTAGQSEAVINSTARTPAGQARVMFKNLTRLENPISINIEKQLRVYAPPGDAVIKVFIDRTKGMTREEIKSNADSIRAEMLEEIYKQGPANVSNHCQDPSVMSAADIWAASFNSNGPLFIAAVQGRVTEFLDERKDNGCYHLALKVT